MKFLEEKKMKGEYFVGDVKRETDQEEKEMMIFFAIVRTRRLLANE